MPPRIVDRDGKVAIQSTERLCKAVTTVEGTHELRVAIDLSEIAAIVDMAVESDEDSANRRDVRRRASAPADHASRRREDVERPRSSSGGPSQHRVDVGPCIVTTCRTDETCDP